ncbi:MAG: NTP transferase domain-containing protein [Burkholderiales bacterium]|jgi:spore coat polysaccharide biosynthesis protein SpsF|nr:NTP transferase domain-containing protein [Burkholderiales bacterium]
MESCQNKNCVVACIIVRLKSTRLPQKALADLDGKPMLLRLIERIKTSRLVTKIVICTSNNPEDAPLLELAQKWGVEAFAGHELNVLSRLIAVAESTDADAVLRITGDNPFTDAKNIDEMIMRHFERSADYTRTNHLPLGVTAEVMSRDMLPRLHDMMPNPNETEYMSFFSFNPKFFRCEVLMPSALVDRPFYSLTVDYPEELEAARILYNSLAHKGDIPALEDVVSIMDTDPRFKEVDPEFLIKKPNGEVITYGALIDELDCLARQASTDSQ